MFSTDSLKWVNGGCQSSSFDIQRDRRIGRGDKLIIFYVKCGSWRSSSALIPAAVSARCCCESNCVVNSPFTAPSVSSLIWSRIWVIFWSRFVGRIASFVMQAVLVGFDAMETPAIGGVMTPCRKSCAWMRVANSGGMRKWRISISVVH